MSAGAADRGPERETGVLARIAAARHRPPRFRDDRITMAHGAGGKASRALVEGLVVPALTNPTLAALGDAAVLALGDRRLAFTTDGYVVRPRRFPGGSLGELAVNGTVNDLAAAGARPLGIAVGLVIEEGLDASELRAVIDAVAAASDAAGVPVVTGDTKVVERGAADGVYVTTSGVGVLEHDLDLGPHAIRPGDRVLVSGPVGDHGIAVLLARDELDLDADIESDTTSLWPVADALLATAGDGLRCMRDATRGGLATVACELAQAADLGIVLDEAHLPIRPAVAAACELLGIEPLHVANEGVLAAVVAPEVAEAACEAARGTTAGAGAVVVGEVVADPPGRVLGRTTFGGQRLIDMLVGDPLPRIC